MAEEIIDVIETVPISDIFCSGVHKIERFTDDLLRVWCYVEQKSHAGSGARELVLVAKIVIPVDAMPNAIELARDALRRAQPNFLR